VFGQDEQDYEEAYTDGDKDAPVLKSISLRSN